MESDELVSAQSLRSWCLQHLAARPTVVLFRAEHLSVAVGLRLDNGDAVVVKVRPPSPRIDACVDVQRHLFDQGFPCPEPLTAVEAFGPWVATCERYIPGDNMMPATGRSARPFAEALARLIGACPVIDDAARFRPSPPWVGWNHDEGALWPWPDDLDIDLNETPGPDWVDAAGRDARDRLRGHDARLVLGHGDFLAPNLRWSGNRLLAVHDWDSVVADTEAAIVGFSAATYPTIQAGDEASIEETAEFLAAYASIRGRRFSPDEIECIWAAGVWQRSFDAKKQFASAGTVASLTPSAADQRLRRAGIR